MRRDGTDASPDIGRSDVRPCSAADAEWPVPDSEDPDQPHFPQVLSWDIRVFGYDSLADVADFLCEGEFRTLTNSILQKLGRPTL